MRLLFIKVQLIGDALILTPTLRAVKKAYPDAEISVLVRRGSEGILAGCPEINRILTIAGPEQKKHTLRSTWEGLLDILRLRDTRYDMAIELSDQHRGRLFAGLASARKRYSVKMFGKMSRWERWRFAAQSTYEWEFRHRVERDYYTVAEFLPCMEAAPGPLVFEKERMEVWDMTASLKNFCVLQIGTWKLYSRWPRERWLEVAQHLLRQCEHIVISTGRATHEVEDARWLQEQLGPRAVCTLGRATWPQVADLLRRARLYVGLDTAAMHLATACGCPVVGLYPTLEERWLPWKSRHRVVLPESYRNVSDPELRRKYRREPRTLEITVTGVVEACDEMLQSA